MEQPNDRDPEERHYVRSDIIDDYLRHFCSFRLRRIVIFLLKCTGYKQGGIKMCPLY